MAKRVWGGRMRVGEGRRGIRGGEGGGGKGGKMMAICVGRGYERGGVGK